MNGNQLMEYGVAPGPQIAHYLNQLRIAQLDGLLRNESEAIQWLQRHSLIRKEPIDDRYDYSSVFPRSTDV